MRVSVVATGIDGTGIAAHPVASASAQPPVAEYPAIAEPVAQDPAAIGVNHAAAANQPEPQDLPHHAATSAEVSREAAEDVLPLNGAAPHQPGVAGPKGEAPEAEKSSRSSLWSIITGGDRGRSGTPKERRRETRRRDDIFVPPPAASAAGDSSFYESDVRPIVNTAPVAGHSQPAKDTVVPCAQEQAQQPPNSGQAGPKPASNPAEDTQNAYANSEDVLEIPAFLRRQAN